MLYTSRSAIERADRCKRARLYEYHWNGTGLTPNAFNIDLEIGSAIHAGLAVYMQAMKDNKFRTPDGIRQEVIHAALKAGLDYFLVAVAGSGADKSEDATYQYQLEEAQALVTAFLYGWGVYRAESFYEQYRVLDVEREEEYCLTQVESDDNYIANEFIILQGKLDALIEDRAGGELKIVSWKSAKEYTDRTAKNAQHDNQGVSETIVVENALEIAISDTNSVILDFADEVNNGKANVTYEVVKQANKLRKMLGATELRWAPSATINAVLMGHFLKGAKTRDSKAPEGEERYIYDCPLIRGWRKWNEGLQEWEYAWCYTPPSDTTKSGKTRLGKGWDRFDAWNELDGGVTAWIDMLMDEDDDGNLRIQNEAGLCFPQQLHESEFCRNEADIKSWLRQHQASEARIFKGLRRLKAAMEPGAIESVEVVMDEEFKQTRSSCHYPSDCPYIPACFDAEVHEAPELATDQYGDKLYRIRVPHHEPERKQLARYRVEMPIEVEVASVEEPTEVTTPFDSGNEVAEIVEIVEDGEEAGKEH